MNSGGGEAWGQGLRWVYGDEERLEELVWELEMLETQGEEYSSLLK